MTDYIEFLLSASSSSPAASSHSSPAISTTGILNNNNHNHDNSQSPSCFRLSHFHNPNQSLKSLQLLYSKAAEAALAYQREQNAALVIQRLWRGYYARLYLIYLHHSAITIQKIYRGYRSRRHVRILKSRQNSLLLQQYYSFAATRIQKIIRGWLSRRTRANYFARSSYLQNTIKTGDKVTAEMEEFSYLHIQETRQQKMEEEEKEFQQITSNLHHLLSTKSCRGVYASVYGSQYDRKAFNRPIEKHIQENSITIVRQNNSKRPQIGTCRISKLPAIIPKTMPLQQTSYLKQNQERQF